MGSTGHTVIDYSVLNTEGINEIEVFRVLDRIESDHMPLYSRLGFKTRKLKGKKLKEVKEIIKWNQQEI